MKFAFYTLGCKVNQYETQAMEQRLTALGHTLGDWTEPCDGFIVNTCTVTAVSDKKCRNIIRRVRKNNPDAVVGVCGCYAQTKPEEVQALEVDVLAGTADRMAFLDAVVEEATQRIRQSRQFWEKATAHREFERLPTGGLAARTRAMLKVQDGCCNYCSYCIIPYARGPIRSLPLSEAVEQAKALAAEGYRELVVTGIEISSWGVDFKDGSSLKDLLSALCAAVPSMRVRLGSLEPRTITEDFCKMLAPYGNLCPQFHLSLQSGCDTVLKRMNRKYDTARYLASVNLLRQYFPHCAITTDLIVAFPGETEAEFQTSLDFLKTCAFAQVHVFPYSRREGTPAAKMDGQHSNDEKARRSNEAGAVADALAQQYRQAMVGRTYAVLFEQPEGRDFTGHTENYVKVYVEAQALHNQVLPVEIVSVEADGVRGRLV